MLNDPARKVPATEGIEKVWSLCKFLMNFHVSLKFLFISNKAPSCPSGRNKKLVDNFHKSENFRSGSFCSGYFSLNGPRP